MDVERYAFRLEHFNELAAVNDAFQLLYYVRRDGKDEIEIVDPKHKRKFLSRVHYPALPLADIHLGGKVSMCVCSASFVGGREQPATNTLDPSHHPPLAATRGSTAWWISRMTSHAASWAHQNRSSYARCALGGPRVNNDIHNAPPPPLPTGALG